MSKKPRDSRPYIRPVTRIELSEKNVRIRLILIVVLLSIAVVSIGVGFSTALNVQPGWNEVQASSDTTNCSVDFKLMYDFSEAGGNAAAVNKKLISLYTDATEQAYRIFSSDHMEEGLGNVAWLNAHVNETVTVNETLYKALTLLEEAGNRSLYLAPVYVEYNRVFSSESDILAAENDPGKNPEAKAYVDAVMAFVSDPEMIRLELLGDNQVSLMVGEEYLAFARELELETFLDFGWMKNAFIADYIAERLLAEGFTHGYLASYDGFTRNLDVRENSYSINIFHRSGNDIYMPARMDYRGPMSVVSVRDYPLSDRDQWHYYAYETGDITTAQLDPADGSSKSSIDGITAYSDQAGCAQILLRIAPVFIADSFDAQALEVLAHEGIQSVRCYDQSVVCTDQTAALTLLDENYTFVISQVE